LARAEHMPADAFSVFIEARLDMLIERLKLLLTGIQVNVVDTGTIAVSSGRPQ